MSFFMDSVTLHKDICNELHNLYKIKNHDYGDSFHQTFVEEGFSMVRIRLSDKLNRFKNLTRPIYPAALDDTSTKVPDETLRDTLLDLANYAIMAIIEMDQEDLRILKGKHKDE